MFNPRPQLLSLIEALEKDIQENPDRRLAELEALRAALSAIEGKAPPAAAQSLVIDSKVRQGSKKGDFRAIVNDLIDRQQDGRVHRRVIINKVGVAGMFPTAKSIDREVSKYLSTDGTFVPDGDGYWKRKAVNEEVKPLVADRSISFFDSEA